MVAGLLGSENLTFPSLPNVYDDLQVTQRVSALSQAQQLTSTEAHVLNLQGHSSPDHSLR